MMRWPAHIADVGIICDGVGRRGKSSAFGRGQIDIITSLWEIVGRVDLCVEKMENHYN